MLFKTPVGRDKMKSSVDSCNNNGNEMTVRFEYLVFESWLFWDLWFCKSSSLLPKTDEKNSFLDFYSKTFKVCCAYSYNRRTRIYVLEFIKHFQCFFHAQGNSEITSRYKFTLWIQQLESQHMNTTNFNWNKNSNNVDIPFFYDKRALCHALNGKTDAQS